MNRIAPLVLVLVLPAFARAQSPHSLSTNAHGAQGNAATYGFAATPDGRFVALLSTATNLAHGPTGGFQQVYVKDRTTGAVELCVVGLGGATPDGEASNLPSISDDGRFVAFESAASNLVANDTNTSSDVFVFDRVTRTTVRASLSWTGAQLLGGSRTPQLSGDGRFCAFEYGGIDAVPNTHFLGFQVYVRDLQLGTTVCASATPSGIPGNSASGFPTSSPAFSTDGRWLVFASAASDLVANDTNSQVDAFLRDLVLGTTQLVSADGLGSSAGGVFPTISSDGRWVAFSARTGSQSGPLDVFVRDMANATVSQITHGVVLGSDGDSVADRITPDGRFVILESNATNLGPTDTNGHATDVLLHDRQTGATGLVSCDATGAQPGVDSSFAWVRADGAEVAWVTAAALSPTDTNATYDVYARDVPTIWTLPAFYCVAKASSLGCVPNVSASGLPALGGPDAFFVDASYIIANRTGLLIFGRAQASIPFAGGTLCIAPPLVRGALQNSGGTFSCTGTFHTHVTNADLLARGWTAGTTVFAQYVYRDPGFAPPNDVGLTNAVGFTVLP